MARTHCSAPRRSTAGKVPRLLLAERARLGLGPGDALPSALEPRHTSAADARSGAADDAAGLGDARVATAGLHDTLAAAARSGAADAAAGIGEGTRQSKRKRDQEEEQIDGNIRTNKTLRAAEAEGVEGETTRAAPSPGDARATAPSPGYARAAAPTPGNARVDAPRLHDTSAVVAKAGAAHAAAEHGDALP
jgi:hypothetical protein